MIYRDNNDNRLREHYADFYQGRIPRTILNLFVYVALKKRVEYELCRLTRDTLIYYVSTHR